MSKWRYIIFVIICIIASSIVVSNTILTFKTDENTIRKICSKNQKYFLLVIPELCWLPNSEYKDQCFDIGYHSLMFFEKLDSEKDEDAWWKLRWERRTSNNSECTIKGVDINKINPLEKYETVLDNGKTILFYLDARPRKDTVLIQVISKDNEFINIKAKDLLVKGFWTSEEERSGNFSWHQKISDIKAVEERIEITTEEYFIKIFCGKEIKIEHTRT